MRPELDRVSTQIFVVVPRSINRYILVGHLLDYNLLQAVVSHITGKLTMSICVCVVCCVTDPRGDESL